MSHSAYAKSPSSVRRILIVGVAVCALFFSLPASRAWAEAEPPLPPPAPAIPMLVTGNVAEHIRNILRGIWNNILTSGITAFFNAASQFTGRVASDAATWIASGGQGKSAMFYKEGAGEYFEKVGKEAAGQALADISSAKIFKRMGIDFCRPKDPRELLNLQLPVASMLRELGLGGIREVRPGAAACNLKDVIKNYENLSTAMSNKDALAMFEKSLLPKNSDLGLALGLQNEVTDYVVKETEKKMRTRLEGSGFKALVGKIDETVKTPSQVIQEATKHKYISGPALEETERTRNIIGVASIVGWKQLAIYTASAFTNTLASQSLKALFSLGIDGSAPKLRNLKLGYEQIAAAGRTDARSASIFFKQVQFDNAPSLDLVAQMISSCEGQARSTWACVMDQGLRQALTANGDAGGMTIREALEKGFLVGSRRLIPALRIKENQDPDCYQKYYCASNLQKLRIARILPVGFEMAANADANLARCSNQGGCVTLDDVLKGFADPKSPWYHLIDENWVLTSIPQQCGLGGYGESLISGDLAQRQTECAEVQTCLQRDDEGKCVGGYGFCVADKTVYRFGATQCPASFASCRTYKNGKGQDVSYLRNTLDYGQCSAENVGCRWYATERDPSKKRSDAWIGTVHDGPRWYADGTVEPCSAADEGCTKLYAVRYAESALNLVRNGSFENQEKDAVTSWDPWQKEPAAIVRQVASGAPAFDGPSSIAIEANRSLSQRLMIEPNRTYTYSVYIRSKTEGLAGDYLTGLILYKDVEGTLPLSVQEMVKDYRSASCDRVDGDTGLVLSGKEEKGQWKRHECTFTTGASAKSGMVVLRGGGVLMDAVQLEESEFATEYLTGINASLPSIHLKVAPDDYACNGLGGAAEHPSCKKYARICRQSEAGCQGYKDTGLPTAPEIPAIVGENDLCPQACVGYAEQRKNPSAFDLVRSADPRFDDPDDQSVHYFIPKSAVQCSQAEVGCRAFTNLENVASGGEQTKYFRAVRSCEKPDANTQTYFTWEGSDTAGYQLRTWSLKQDVRRQVNPNEPVGGPKVLEKPGIDQTAFKEPTTCSRETWLTGADPDCREVYDRAGHVFYRYLSQTVLSTESCTAFRLNGVTAGDCKASMGAVYNTATGECVYNVSVPESTSCQARAVGCTSYAGVNAGNVLAVYSEDFRSSVTAFTGGVTSSEALRVGDVSYRLDSKDQPPVVRTTVRVPTVADGLYRVTFWAKAPAAGSQTVALVLTASDMDDPQKNRAIGTVALTADWQRFTVGSFSGDSKKTLTEIAWAAQTPRIYLDEVRVEKIQDLSFVNAGSWTTPAVCDQSRGGVPQPQAMLGCRAYRDRYGQTVHARSFSRLCREAAIGCTAFVDTRNSASIAAETFVQKDAVPIPIVPSDAGGQKFGVYGSATIVRSADRYVYLIDEPSKRCQPEQASCRAFGRPLYSADRLSLSGVTSTENPNEQAFFETVYLKDDITAYDKMLCKPSELFCDAFSAGGGTEYFRAPEAKACDYRTSVLLRKPDLEAINKLSGKILNLPEGDYAGWFRAGGNLPCYPELIESGSRFGLARLGDGEYRAWAGLCAREVDACTEFRDLNDTSDPVYKVSGRPYHFLRDDQMDLTSCNGQVDVARGCILLRDMSDTRLTYNTEATYTAYREKGHRPIPPINCELVPRDAYCKTALNDANVLVKADVDRDCAQWLGCKSAITVLDTTTRKYRDICTDLALCDKGNDKDDAFCAHYVDQSASSTEPILKNGAFFSQALYASRKVGLGEKDYSGYAIPNAFQLMDLKNMRVAAEGIGEGRSSSPEVLSRYARDYRLAAMARMPFVKGEPETWENLKPFEASPLEQNELGPSYAGLYLCRHKGTGMVGYYRVADRDAARSDAGKSVFCYLPVRRDDLRADQGSEISAYNFHKLAAAFIEGMNANVAPDDLDLRKAFPDAECRVHPEQDAPFSTDYVTDWQDEKNPPRAVSKLNGYAGANTCEFGEDCACAYKRVDYSGAAAVKFFADDSPNVPAGICQGGPKNGEKCLPESVFRLPSTDGSSANAALTAAELANQSQTCGPPDQGGRCAPFSKLEVVRGIFGNCLERDVSRSQGEGFLQNPCLTWNPSLILLGEKDPYHYQPTAGYNPPENSGRYYCLDQPKQPQVMRLAPMNFKGFFRNDDDIKVLNIYDVIGDDRTWSQDKWGDYINDVDKTRLPRPEDFYAGKILAFHYGSNLISSGSGGSYGGSFGATLQTRPGGTSQTANDCEAADNHEDEHTSQEPYALRLVSAGSVAPGVYTPVDAHDSSYTETFFQLADGPNSVDNFIKNEDIAFISAVPMESQSERGRIACGYQLDWVDGMQDDEPEYGSVQWLSSKEKEWKRGFYEKYKGPMTRAGEVIVMHGSADQQKPTFFKCLSGKQTDGDTVCALKYWETGYQSEGQQQLFIGVDEKRQLRDLRYEPLRQTCTSDKPYFGIRAVFDTNATKLAERNGEGVPMLDSVTREKLEGATWTLAGFWVSTCAPKAKDFRHIYMNVSISTAGICKEIAEVRSRDSKSDAAFTDRVWKASGYSLPVLGLQYGQRFAPFSSVLSTGSLGSVPLYQTGGVEAGRTESEARTTLQAGQDSYWDLRIAPEGKTLVDGGIIFPRPYSEKGPVYGDTHAYLMNLFARVYQIYYWDTGSRSYKPERCPDNTEFCGLLAYKIDDTSKGGSLDQTYNWGAMPEGRPPKPFPTDVTLGHYTPPYLGMTDFTHPGFFTSKDAFSFISYYTPRPPRVAAPDARSCKIPGRCPIQRTDMFSLDGFSDGVVSVPGGQHKSTMRFYAWAAHNQMPLRSITIDWGDGTIQQLPDAKLKNRKPFCNGRKECSDPIRGSGITCLTDNDCPAGAGVCKDTGACNANQHISCFSDADCPKIGQNKDRTDSCLFRTFFGNSAEACEQNYIEVSHVYTCQNEDAVAAKCGTDFRCSRNPAKTCDPAADPAQQCAAGDACLPNMAQPGGCWDEPSNACRFTPRVMLKDNWGWCTGECRAVREGDVGLKDPKDAKVLHQYGGCYSWNAGGASEDPNIRFNSFPYAIAEDIKVNVSNECSQKYPNKDNLESRPWIVYPGSIQLGSEGIARDLQK